MRSAFSTEFSIATAEIWSRSATAEPPGRLQEPDGNAVLKPGSANRLRGRSGENLVLLVGIAFYRKADAAAAMRRHPCSSTSIDAAVDSRS